MEAAIVQGAGLAPGHGGYLCRWYCSCCCCHRRCPLLPSATVPGPDDGRWPTLRFYDCGWGSTGAGVQSLVDSSQLSLSKHSSQVGAREAGGTLMISGEHG